MPRALDVVVAALALALVSPLLALAGLLIRLESRGAVFYRQRRVGLHGRPFELWKLRTMVPGAAGMGAGIYVLQGDPRITRVGRRLRRFSLDELPNLVNVLRGEMAIVGPRPTVQEQVDRYTERQRQPPPGQARHHRLGPGQRPHHAALARANRAGRLVRGAPLPARST